ncbi:MAG: hypothetical protein U0744_07480 [Gemmataceae bacterium]
MNAKIAYSIAGALLLALGLFRFMLFMKLADEAGGEMAYRRALKKEATLERASDSAEIWAADQPVTISGKATVNGKPRENILVVIHNADAVLAPMDAKTPIEITVASIASRPNISLRKKQQLVIRWPKDEDHSFTYWSDVHPRPGEFNPQKGNVNQFEFDWIEDHIYLFDSIDAALSAYVTVVEGKAFCYTDKNGEFAVTAILKKNATVRFYYKDHRTQRSLSGVSPNSITVDFVEMKQN